MEWGAIGRFGVFKHLAFKITDYHAVGIMAEDVIGVHRHLATSSWRIDDILWNRVAGGMTPELFHKLKSTPYAGT